MVLDMMKQDLNLIMDKNKQQTLDCPYNFTSRCTMGRCDCKPIIPAGAEWEVTRMFGKEDVINIAKRYAKRCQAPIQSIEWLEQHVAEYRGDTIRINI